MEYNFLPYFYKEKRNKNKNCIVNIIIVILLIIFCILIYRIINVYNETNRLKESIKNINYSRVNNKVISYTDDNNHILKNTRDFFEYTDHRLEFESLIVENKMINANIILNTKDEYEETIRYIENKASWKIIKLSPVKKETEDKFRFQISMEVKRWKKFFYI